MLVRHPGQKTNTYICPQLESSMGQPPTIAQDYRYQVHHQHTFFPFFSY